MKFGVHHNYVLRKRTFSDILPMMQTLQKYCEWTLAFLTRTVDPLSVTQNTWLSAHVMFQCDKRKDLWAESLKQAGIVLSCSQGHD